VIGGRYLASAAVVRAQPFGPVEALDTQSGRAAQVRIVFVPGTWQEEELAEAVSRWCGLGCAEVCGVLDFGRHDDRWYLSVPPSLGMSLERWRAVRQPSAGDAARLVLGFGRLVERIATCGFRADSADLRDLAVGPGPTPFLERPLLGDPGDDPPSAQEGEHVLGSVLATIAPQELPPDLSAWRDNALAGTFTTLTECLDELERCAGAAAGREQEQHDGLEGLFDDEDLSVLLPGHGEGRGRRRLLAGLGLLAIVSVALVLAAPRLGSAAPPAQASPPAPDPAPSTVAPQALQQAPAHKPRHGPRRQARRPPRRHQRRPAPRAPSAPAPTPRPPSASAGVSPGPSSSAGVPVLPAPGGVTTLPPPG